MSKAEASKPAGETKKPEKAAKKPYEKPAIASEALTAVAALCNGTTGGGRKATTPACTASRLKS
ncbi:MAG: hypothetical protein NDJ90_08385 [Oligoflexia bacterium]|nr:hypothetical protein [Oligoflexia bacterium]